MLSLCQGAMPSKDSPLEETSIISGSSTPLSHAKGESFSSSGSVATKLERIRHLALQEKDGDDVDERGAPSRRRKISPVRSMSDLSKRYKEVRDLLKSKQISKALDGIRSLCQSTLHVIRKNTEDLKNWELQTEIGELLRELEEREVAKTFFTTAFDHCGAEASRYYEERRAKVESRGYGWIGAVADFVKICRQLDAIEGLAKLGCKSEVVMLCAGMDIEHLFPTDQLRRADALMEVGAQEEAKFAYIKILERPSTSDAHKKAIQEKLSLLAK